MRMAKKPNKRRKEISFFQVAVTWFGPSLLERHSWHSYFELRNSAPFSTQPKACKQGKQLKKSASKGSPVLLFPRLIFFPLPNKEPVVPITDQNSEYNQQTSILMWCSPYFRELLLLLKHFFIRNFLVIMLRGRGGCWYFRIEKTTTTEKQTTSNF